jgi:hypothetical protein
MADALDVIRDDALLRRVKGVSGGNRILWSAKDIAVIRDYVAAMPAKIIRAAPTAVRKFIDVDLVAVRRKFAETGLTVNRDMQPNDRNFLVPVTTEGIDHENDSVKIPGVDCSIFNKNRIVPLAHDTSALPIAISSAPWLSSVSGKAALMAIAKFPEPGVSAESDRVAAAIRAGMFRGASIGFIPLKWSFSTDPSRPLGVDFNAVKLLEWSFCSLPCNPECILIGAVSGGKSASRSSRNDNVPAQDESDWECHAIGTMPIDFSDDAFNATAAKAALLARFSPAGTITDEARDYFLAVDISAPLDASSYKFPFCRAADGAIVASKTGWRQSFAALEQSNMPSIVIGEARSLVDKLEARLGEVKTADRRREARAFAAKVRSVGASISDRVPMTREQRIAEASAFRRAAMAAGK